MELLKKLVSIQGVSGDESTVSKFIQNYCEENMSGWKKQPKIIVEPHLHDCLILVFGDPKTAIYAHIDTIGYTVGYSNNLIPIVIPFQKCVDYCVYKIKISYFFTTYSFFSKICK